MSDVIIQISDGLPFEIAAENWKVVASATHVVLRDNYFVGDRLVVRQDVDGRIIVCAELKSADGSTLSYGEQLTRSDEILTAMLRITKRFNLPLWLADKCLIEFSGRT